MERWIDDGERGERGNGKIDRKMDAWLGGRVEELVASINKWMNRCMAGCWLNEWMDGWMNGWMVREMKSLEVRRDIKRWMNTGQLPFCNSPFSFFLPLSPTSLHSRIFGLCLAMSLFLCLREALSLPFPLSLSLAYSDQMSNSCGAVAWLINALEEPREVEHNKQTEEGEEKEREARLEREEWERVRANECVCVRLSPSDRNPILKPLHQVVWFSEGGTLPLIRQSVLSFPV